jgi:hypothetical protein
MSLVKTCQTCRGHHAKDCGFLAWSTLPEIWTLLVSMQLSRRRGQRSERFRGPALLPTDTCVVCLHDEA